MFSSKLLIVGPVIATGLVALKAHELIAQDSMISPNNVRKICCE